jgi:hypothetical protein
VSRNTPLRRVRFLIRMASRFIRIDEAAAVLFGRFLFFLHRDKLQTSRMSHYPGLKLGQVMMMKAVGSRSISSARNFLDNPNIFKTCGLKSALFIRKLNIRSNHRFSERIEIRQNNCVKLLLEGFDPLVTREFCLALGYRYRPQESDTKIWKL